ncbi:class I SAM-dependent methyltransferase [Acuticoccus sediminis]|uniref:class I SAM-dependent methyltransferase n=1 Tax=Acuticoccus sediminis TaxID=2184697 RepID=UPI001CFD9A2D|nr:class I SAM-dependent methyltransferase [Acuticoccus sediminis]
MAAPAQVWSAETYQRHARFVSDLADGVTEWLAPRPGERILDLGCGDGVLTEKLAASGATVLGVDASPDFVAAATARGLDVRLVDGMALPFEAEFDAVFTNAALHWMLEPAKVAAGVRRALKPGGRYVGEFGGHANVASLRTALAAIAPRYGVDPARAHPWYFPTPETFGRLLAENGFSVSRCVLIPRPTILPDSGIVGWIETFMNPYLKDAAASAPDVLAEAEALLAPALRDANGVWTADYVRIRFEANAI